MSRTYSDPIEVRRSGEDLGESSPIQFLWRGRLYVVGDVIAYWIESGAWWGGSRRALEGSLLTREHEVWRVEARAGRSDSAGVYDLRRDLVADRWVLVRAMD